MKISALPLALLLLFLVGCGSTSARHRALILIYVSPVSAQLAGSESQQFTATVLNTANPAVTWAVAGGGTISTWGLYTAPAAVTTQAAVTVTATSVADPAKAATATLTLMPPVSVSPSVSV